ncbi:hypothetical protein ABTE18_22085, partial [Acinetobacter baumannii]
MQRRNVLALLGGLLLGGSRMLRRALAAPASPGTAPSLAAVVDTLFPGGDGLPAASSFGLHERVL